MFLALHVPPISLHCWSLAGFGESGKMSSRCFIRLPRTIAHRGASGTAPENTLVAIRRAAELGATWVEVDVNVTADTVPVLMHDNTLARTTGGSGVLILTPLREIQGLDSGAWFGPGFVGEPVPTLAQAMELANKLGLGLNLEIKPTAGWEEPTTAAMCAMVKEHWPSDRPILLSSFSERCLATMRRELPSVPRGYLTAAIPPDWRDRLELHDCATIHLNAVLLREENPIGEIKKAGYGVLVYTVNDEAQAQRLFELGVDAIFTDFPERFSR